MDFWQAYAEAARTATGFFWKAGWAFVLGYGISAMIQAFVPKGRLRPALGRAGARSVSLATFFGAVSSSCSFAALAAARSLVQKGANFVAAVAFMFASTNLVIELGILIVIFLGWEFLAAELAGGLLLIAVSSVLMTMLVPQSWREAARRRSAENEDQDDDDFDWRQRIGSRAGWRLVGRRFIGDWKMVWEEILIGFTVAGFVATLVSPGVWESLFMAGGEGGAPALAAVLQNAAVAPFVAAATFIGSMGNIPLATVLHANGVLFAGIMGFIYSDLMVPPLVVINARYYGKRIALAIAGVMYVSIVITAVVMQLVFGWLDVLPDSGRRVESVVHFAMDYTLVLNVVFAAAAVVLVRLGRGGHKHHHHEGMDHGGGGPGVKTVVAWLSAVLLVGGWIVTLTTG